MSIYDPFYNHLNKEADPLVKMTFADIERIIGKNLPKTARKRNQWWANETSPTTRHIQCNAWRGAGYIANVDLEAQTVTFRKVTIPKPRTHSTAK